MADNTRFDPVRGDRMIARFEYDDVLEASRDYLLSGSRFRDRVTAAHPLADKFSEKRARYVDLLAALLDRDGRPIDLENSQRNLSAAIGSGHAGTLLSTFGKIPATAQLHETIRDIRDVCGAVELQDYRPAPFPVLSVNTLSEPTATSDGSQIEMISIAESGNNVQLKTKTYKLMFSRALVANDDRSLIEAAFTGFGAAAGRRIGRDFVTYLESNPTLADGLQLFNSTTGNTLTSGEVSVTALNAMLNAMRTQTTDDGEYLNLRPRYVLCNPADETTVRVLLAANWQMTDRINDFLVPVVLPWLAAGAWYLAADPQTAPAIAMATLQGAGGEIMSLRGSARSPGIGDANGSKRVSFDGVATDITLNYGFGAVSHAIVKNTSA